MQRVGCLVVHIQHGTYVCTPCSLAAGTDRLQSKATVQWCNSSAQPCRKTVLRPITGHRTDQTNFPMAQTLFMGYGERRIAAATNVTNSANDSLTNVKNETNSTKALHRLFRRSYIVTCTSQERLHRFDHCVCVTEKSLMGV